MIHRLQKTFDRTATSSCLVTGVVATLVLLGWHFDISLLKSVSRNYITMKANTSVGLIWLACSLWLLRMESAPRWKSIAGKTFAVLTFALAAVTLSQYLLDWNLGIDELLYTDPSTVKGLFPPGRFAPITAVTFMVISSAILLANSRWKNLYGAAQVLAAIAFIIAFQALLGYIFGMTYTFGLAFYSQMAVHTALLFSILSLGLLASRSNHGFMAVMKADSIGGRTARQLILWAVLAPPIINWIQLAGQQANLYDADFGVLIRIVGNIVFLVAIIWRNSVALHESDLERRSAELRRIQVEDEANHAERTRTELLLREQAAQDSNHLKTQFLANMSHEIRTPISGVIGTTSLLLDTELTEEQRKLTEAAHGSAESLLAIVNDILDLSKIEAGKLDFEHVDFSLKHVLAGTIKMLSLSAQEKNISLHVKMEPRLVDAVNGDPGRIRQVLVNLMGNGIKFTQSGHVEVHAETMASFVGRSRVRFRVEDTGIGLSAQAIERMFKPFSQADASTTRRFGGTGLGLSICKHLVEGMGGTIGVKSVEGKGSCFWFTLELAHAVHSISEVKSTKIAHHLSGFILVADDVRVNQIVAAKQLEKMGCKVDVVSDGVEALEALERAHYDLVLMDCQMPRLDGYEATRIIRASTDAYRDLPIIAMTANAMKGDREACLAAGMNDYISKPIRTVALAAMLTKWLAPEGVILEAIEPVEQANVLSTDDPVLDESVLDSLRGLFPNGGADAFLKELLVHFSDGTATALKRMALAVETTDGESLRREAHGLKSSGGNLGAARFAALCERIETLSAQEDWVEAGALVVRLSLESDCFQNALNSVLPHAPEESAA